MRLYYVVMAMALFCIPQMGKNTLLKYNQQPHHKECVREQVL